MILSIFQHISGYTEKIDIMNTYLDISGTHSFPTFIHHKACQHGPLPVTDRKPYMAPGQKLIVLNICINGWIFVRNYRRMSNVKWLPHCQILHKQKWTKNIFEGSLALKKVTEAVLGAHNHNFDDLEHYSGNIEIIQIFSSSAFEGLNIKISLAPKKEDFVGPTFGI